MGMVHMEVVPISVYLLVTTNSQAAVNAVKFEIAVSYLTEL